MFGVFEKKPVDFFVIFLLQKLEKLTAIPISGRCFIIQLEVK